MGRTRIHNLLAQLQEYSEPAPLEAEFKQAVKISEIRKLKGARSRIHALLENLKTEVQ